MPHFDLNNISPDENRIAKIVMFIVGVGVLLALGVVITFGWQDGATPLWNPCRPEIVTLARWVLDAGLIAAAFVLGLPEPSRTSNLRVLFAATGFFVVLISFGVSGARGGHHVHLDKPTEIQFVMCLVLPVVAFGLANLIRIASKRT